MTSSSDAVLPPVLSSDPPPPPSSTDDRQTINVGTRKSLLARIQADLVIEQLKQTSPHNNYVVHAISTMGDKNQVTALHDFNAKSLWTHELEAMLVNNEVDFIVHCLKDMPTQLPTTCALGPIMKREDPRDAVCLSPRLPSTTTLRSLPAGSVIGTSSVRRTAQLARSYPHLKFQSVRGNVGTRLSKLDAEDSPYSALILAAAGLLRLDLGHRISALLSSRNTDGGAREDGRAESKAAGNGDATQWGMLHAVGQGALAIEMRLGDSRIASLLAPLNDPSSALACLAERSLMRTLEGGCSVPIGVETEWEEEDTSIDTKETANTTEPSASTLATAAPTKRLTMRATVVSVSGDAAACAAATAEVRTAEDADEFGWMMAKKLVEDGADKILAGINLNREVIKGEGGGA